MKQQGVVWQHGYEVLVIAPGLLWRAYSSSQLRPWILSLADATPDEIDALDDLILIHAHLSADSRLGDTTLRANAYK